MIDFLKAGVKKQNINIQELFKPAEIEAVHEAFLQEIRTNLTGEGANPTGAGTDTTGAGTDTTPPTNPAAKTTPPTNP
ncbi:hypothetical protein [Candidatus Phytoplasma solani]|uniref:hypothetical protein n=1 Tax=Candidatus Phytoplasma solani TaxID=69896 RepID=UPI00359012FE